MHALSPFEPFEPGDPFDPPHILDTEVVDAVGESFTPGEPSVADFTLLDEVANEAIEESLDKDNCSQRQTEPQRARLIQRTGDI